jgi:hypothetical protein
MVGRVPRQTGGAVEHLIEHRIPSGGLTACRLRADSHAQRSHAQGVRRKGFLGFHRTPVEDARRERVFRPTPSEDAAVLPGRAANNVLPAAQSDQPAARSGLRVPMSGSAPQASALHPYAHDCPIRFCA